jgi:hypothetical protein
MSSRRHRSHDRSPDQTSTSISLPKKLLEQIRTLAGKQERSASAQIRIMLADAIADYERAQTVRGKIADESARRRDA